MRRSASVVSLLALLAACSGDSDGTGPDPECAVSAVTVTGAPTTLVVGQTAQLGTTITQEHCGTLTPTWQSSNANVLAVSASGLLTAVSAGGPVTITATAGGKSGTAQISVTAVVAVATSVVVLPDSMIIPLNGSLQVAATARDANGTAIPGRTFTWSTNFAAIATVNDGLVSSGGTASPIVAATISAATAGANGNVTGTAKVYSAAPRLAYFWAHDPSNPAPITPHGGYAFNSGAAAMSVTRFVAGQYTLGWAGLGRTGILGDLGFVTAYGEVDGLACVLGPHGSGNSSVYCRNAAGTATDSYFTFSVIGVATFGGRSGYARTSDGAAVGPYAPEAITRYSSSNLPITVTRTGAGVYVVRFAGQGRTATSTREAVIVSTYFDGTNTQCQAGGWASAGADLDITVRCFTPAGAAGDATFSLALLSEPRAGAKLAFADADQPAAVAAYTPANAAVRPNGTVTVTRNGAGRYTVQFAGFSRSAGATETFHVTAVGTDARRCRVIAWGGDGAGSTVDIGCATAAGVSADTRFVVVGLQ